MQRKPVKKLEEQDRGYTLTWTTELPTEYPCQIYPRVSTPEQKKNVSAEMQKDKSFAIKLMVRSFSGRFWELSIQLVIQVG